MNDVVKSWVVTYRHPISGKTLRGIEHAATKRQATQKAMDHNTPTENGSFFWEIESVEELKEATL